MQSMARQRLLAMVSNHTTLRELICHFLQFVLEHTIEQVRTCTLIARCRRYEVTVATGYRRLMQSFPVVSEHHPIDAVDFQHPQLSDVFRRHARSLHSADPCAHHREVPYVSPLSSMIMLALTFSGIIFRVFRPDHPFTAWTVIAFTAVLRKKDLRAFRRMCRCVQLAGVRALCASV